MATKSQNDAKSARPELKSSPDDKRDVARKNQKPRSARETPREPNNKKPGGSSKPGKRGSG